MLDHVDQMNSAVIVFAASRPTLSDCAPKPRGCPWRGAEGDAAYGLPLGWCVPFSLPSVTGDTTNSAYAVTAFHKNRNLFQR